MSPSKKGKAGSSRLPEPMPGLVAFDLDYTLWPCWCDTHVTPPVKRRKQEVNTIYDRSGQAWSFYEDVPSILLQLKHANVEIAAASRTHTPDVARQMLKELLIPASADPIEPGREQNLIIWPQSAHGGQTIAAIELFDQLEIYPSDKKKHMRALHEKTGIAYEDMLFFDDESRNRNVAQLGVTFMLVGNGLDRRCFEQGLAEWRKAKEAGEKGKVKVLDRDSMV